MGRNIKHSQQQTCPMTTEAKGTRLWPSIWLNWLLWWTKSGQLEFGSSGVRETPLDLCL